MTRVAFGAEFCGAEGYLDSPTVGLPPRFVVDAVSAHVHSWGRGELYAPDIDRDVEAARAGYASLVGVPAQSVAIGGSVSALLGLIAAAVPDGARVLTVSKEFTSVSFPFAAQSARGVTVTELEPAEVERRAGEFDVVAVSLVQSAGGRTLDVDTLRANVGDALTVIDVTQALGWCQVDVSWADVTVGGAYKWLLAPRGMAWMSVRDSLLESITAHGANWYAGQDPWSTVYGLPLRLAPGAKRLDTSPSWISAIGAGAALPWLAGLDRAAVHRHTVGLAAVVRHHLGLAPIESAIVSIPVAGAEDRLRAAGIRAAVRAGAVRVGFHLYNTGEDVERLLDALR
ncbi:aminotransferase class V [Mycobacterium sp. MS1601]|uniref:aminotransferase class V-fold PLP-dependent enzyme n=1 Tax=Mycobacterium sp. MS1601 TaxID=1936029 RepID=UPI0009791D0E|nr:aminotransferase class V-fold PLP-dependent enzyme [Mycobacterium sp. MS1601]AQA01972.1 aminotransferase class V [Mycobacterium sp. MS1601]